MNAPSGFTVRCNKDGGVVVFHHGRRAVSLNKSDGAALIEEIAGAGTIDVQHVLARVTGNYKRGNERLARSHHRNRE